MQFLNFLYSLFSKSNTAENKNEVTEKSQNYIGLGPDKIDMLLKKYNCEDQEELLVKLEEIAFKYEEFTEDEKIFYNDPQFQWLKGFADLWFTLDSEQKWGRSLAIQELTENRYQIQLDEGSNQFKELINFTLSYYHDYFIDKPIEAEETLKADFPMMHQYIKRKILNQQFEIPIKTGFDEQDAYDEFLYFCKDVFCTLYPVKSIRDAQIKNHFKILHFDLIQFVDDEQ